MKAMNALLIGFLSVMFSFPFFTSKADALFINPGEAISLDFDISASLGTFGPITTIGSSASFFSPLLGVGDTFRIEIFDAPSISVFNHTFVASGPTSGIGTSKLAPPSALADGIGSIVVSDVNRQLDLRWVTITLISGNNFLPSFFFFTSDPNNDFVTSTVAPVPLPAALPLFAGGLGFLGLMGWRRKRKVAAV